MNTSPLTKRPILVVGATGRQGGAVVRHLLTDGWPVRVLVRDPHAPGARELAARGAEPVTGDLDVPHSLDPAVTGAHGVFFAPPVAYRNLRTDVAQEYRRGRDLIEAADRAGVEHIVFSGIASVPPAGLPGSGGKRRIEQRLRSASTVHTIFRPVRFMENYLFENAPMDGIQDGVNPHLFLPHKPVQLIAVDDIGRFAALAFADPAAYGGQAIELAGDDPTPEEAAAAIGAAVGASVRYQRLTLEQAGALNSEIADTWHLITDNGDNGWHADLADLRVRHPGMATLAGWLAESGAESIRAVIERGHTAAG